MAGITFTEASGVNDSIFKDSQAPIRLFIEKRAEAFEQNSMLPKLFKMVNSRSWAEKYASMTAMDGFQPVGEMGKHPHDEMGMGFEKIIEHEVWKNRFSISREIIDDGKLMDLEGRPGAFIAGYYRTREKYGAAMFGGAIQGKNEVEFGGRKFNALGADGMPLFSSSHRWGGEYDSASASSYNNTHRDFAIYFGKNDMHGHRDTLNLFADAFSNDALMALESKMQDVRDDKGNVLTVAPTTILIPNDYQLKKEVFAAIGADKDPATANNGFNYTYGRWNVIVWQYLNQYITAGTKPWVLLDEQYNDEHAGAVFQDRVQLEVDSYIDKDTNANVWDGYARFGAGFNDWRGYAVGGLSGGDTLIGA